MDSPISGVPQGFGMTLLQDPQAARAFYAMPSAQRRDILTRARAVNTRAEMQSLVDQLRTLGHGPGPARNREES